MKLFISGLLLLAFSAVGFAGEMGSRKLGPAIESGYTSAAKVFVGTVMPLVNRDEMVVVHVNTWFKGGDEGKVMLSCQAICANGILEAGAQYLIYASKGETDSVFQLYTDSSLTKLRIHADLDIRLLKDMPLPFRDYDDSAWWFNE